MKIKLMKIWLGAFFIFLYINNLYGFYLNEKAIVKIFVYDNIFLEKINEVVVAIPSVGHGSGTMINNEGLILTAAHVVKDARFIAVWIPDYSQALPAEVLYIDEEQDFAYISVIGKFENYAKLPQQSPLLSKGDNVWAYGYPIMAGEPEPSITKGIISRFSQKYQMWQIDTPLNPGNSGGPLVNSSGEIVGICIGKLKDAESINFAISIERPIKIYRELLSTYKYSDLKKKQLNEDYEMKKLKEKIAIFIADITIDKTKFISGGNKFLKDSSKFIKSNTEATQISNIASLVSAYFFDLAALILIEENTTLDKLTSLPKNKFESFMELLSNALIYADIAAKSDPLFSEKSEFIRILSEAKRELEKPKKSPSSYQQKTSYTSPPEHKTSEHKVSEELKKSDDYKDYGSRKSVKADTEFKILLGGGLSMFSDKLIVKNPPAGGFFFNLNYTNLPKSSGVSLFWDFLLLLIGQQELVTDSNKYYNYFLFGTGPGLTISLGDDTVYFLTFAWEPSYAVFTYPTFDSYKEPDEFKKYFIFRSGQVAFGIKLSDIFIILSSRIIYGEEISQYLNSISFGF